MHSPYITRLRTLQHRNPRLKKDCRILFDDRDQAIEFGNAIKFSRELQSITIAQAAEQMGVTEQTYERIEAGYWYSILTSTILKLCALLDLEPKEFTSLLPADRYPSKIGPAKPKRTQPTPPTELYVVPDQSQQRELATAA